MRTLYVGGLPPETDSDGLRALFEAFGEVSAARVVMRAHGGCRGFGYVTFAQPEAALRARRELDGTERGGGRLRVAEAR